MASSPPSGRPRSHSLSLPLGNATGLSPRSPLAESLQFGRNSQFDKHSRAGSYGSGLGLNLEGLGVPRSRSPTSATESSSSASEVLTPASSPLRDQPVKIQHERVRSGYDSICESAEHAIDLDGDYETAFEGTTANGGGTSLYANGARWGWPASSSIGQLPNRKTSAPLLSGSLPSGAGFAPLSRVMSGGNGTGNNGFGSAGARERDNGNTPEGLGLFRRLSVGFGSKVRRYSFYILLDRRTDVLRLRQPRIISPPLSTTSLPTPICVVTSAPATPVVTTTSFPAGTKASPTTREGGRRLSTGSGTRPATKRRGISPMGEKMLRGGFDH